MGSLVFYEAGVYVVDLELGWLGSVALILVWEVFFCCAFLLFNFPLSFVVS